MALTDTYKRLEHPPSDREVTPEELNFNQQWGRCELIDGKVILMSPAGHNHGKLGAELLILIGQYVKANKLGEVYAAETGFVFPNGKTVRAPDVMFLSTARIPPDMGEDVYLPIAPDFAVEVVSLSDKFSDATAKAESFLSAGVRLVWVVQPNDRSVHVFRQGQAVRVYKSGETLGGEDVLPGLNISVDQIFER